MNSKCFCFKQSNNHRLCLPKYNSQHTFFWCLQSVKSAQSLSLSLALYKTTCIHYFSRVSVYASQYVRRLGQLVPLNVIRLHTVLYEVQIAVIKCWNTTWEGANSWTLWSQTHLDKQQQVWGRGGGREKMVGKRNCVKCVKRCTWLCAVYGSLPPRSVYLPLSC